MILDSIELKNIRSYDQEKIEFPRGITLFEGDVGSGKSSVLMAIEFALFGLGSQKPDALLSKKATEGHVILNFEVEDKKYEVRRTLKRKGDSVLQDSKTSYLISDGIEEPLAVTELKQRIMQILKFNEPPGATSESRIYRYAVFTPQEEMKQILRDSSKRLETIRRAFGIENYKTAIDNAKNLISEIKTWIEVYKTKFSNMEEFNDQLEGTRKNIEELLRNISGFQKEKDKLLSEKETARKILEKARQNQVKKQDLEKDKGSLEEKINDFTSDVNLLSDKIKDEEEEIKKIQTRVLGLKTVKKPTSKSLVQLDEQIKEFEDLKDQIHKTRTEIESMSKESSKLTKKLGDYVKEDKITLEKEKDQLEELIPELNGQLDDLTKSIQKNHEQKAKLEDRIDDFKKRVDVVSKLGQKCPVCENKLTPAHIEKLKKERKTFLQKFMIDLEKINKEIKRLLANKESLENKVGKADDRVSELEKVLPMLNEWHEQNTNLDKLKQSGSNRESTFKIPEEKSFPNGGRYEDPVSYLRGQRDALIEYNNTADKIENDELSLKKVQRNLKSSREQKLEKEEKITGFQNKKKDLLKKNTMFGDVEREYEKSEKNFEKISDAIIEVEKSLAATNQNLSSEKEDVLRIGKEIQVAQQAKTQYQKFNDHYNWLYNFFIPTIDVIEKQVLLSIQQSFNTVYQKWFAVLIEDPTKQTRIDEEFSPIIEQDGYEQDVEYLSGGEKTSVALAYRLALNSMIRQETESLKSNLLILDEPTDGFSKSQLSKVKSILQELNSQQIILVSHEKELETYVNNIFQITKDEGFSHVNRLN